ncbi:MAG: hypothetical protein XU15_C0011G0087 [candidate division NC10 bacterium CSP1-5]|nr:MAG: hypothetical protein XU15_C0011G0087 [candidate division NC10 bacterium CSP1-5]
MRPTPNPRVEPYRVKRGRYAGAIGNNGAFLIPGPDHGKLLYLIVSDGGEWEHVSVSKKGAVIPSWDEMSFVRHLFWEPEECVVQYHPPQSRYINIHPGVLHLWRPIHRAIPMPPLEFV